MEFTGERFVPGARGLEELYAEHMSRYSFASRLASGKRVLDVGCGCGYGTHLIAASGAAEALGVDISPEAVAFADERYKLPNLRYEVADSRKLELYGPFDLITCFELIEHVEEDAAVVGAMASMLSESGICLVSTPNASTYVAGGEEGSNPYHFREYEAGEFEALLRARFPHVLMLEQRWVEGLLITPPDALASAEGDDPADGKAGLLPDDHGRMGPPSAYGPASYFIAACSHSDAAAQCESLSCLYVACSGDLRYRKLKGEFDQRGKWANRLDDELREKGGVIGSLREEKARLEREVDQRGKWALRLDGEIKQKDELIEKLMADNERLKKAVILAGK